jgi:catechol 2,3-dioxygenase-like lactoylglutathione lyase family enzyme
MLSEQRVQAIIPSQDVAALRRFYEETLGLQPAFEYPGAVMYGAAHGTRFAISRSGGRSDGSFTQMSFEVEDLDAEIEDLRRRGVVFEEYDGPTLKTEGGIARMPAGRAAWFRDPEGNMIGLISFDAR